MTTKVLWCGHAPVAAIPGIAIVEVADADALAVALRDHDPDAIVVDRALADSECASILESRAPRAIRLVYNGDGAPPYEGGLQGELNAVELGIAIGAARTHRTLPALDHGTTVAGRLARALVHDVNNPLTVVMSSLDLLADRLKRSQSDVGDMPDLVVEALDATRKIADLVNAHRSLARDLPEARSTLALTTVVERAIFLTTREFADDVRLEARLDDTPAVHADEARLLRSMATLLFVVRSAAAPGIVRLATFVERERAVIDVRYRGRALSSEERRPIVALVEKLDGAWSHGGNPVERTILIVLPTAKHP
jgi:signal transduction histidine kinase